MAVREHGDMLDALAKRDGAALRDILRAHLEHKHDALIAELERAQNVAA